jgi:hypothetical protein
MKQNFIFASCFSRSHFSFTTKKFETPCRNGCSYKKGSLGKDVPSIGTLVGLLLAMTRLAASALLELSSSALSSWRGLCRQPDWALHRLGTRALAPRVCSWSDQGRKPNSAVSSASGSSKIFFFAIDDQRAAIRWLVFGGPWEARSRLHKIGQSPTRRFSQFFACWHFHRALEEACWNLVEPL